MAIGARVTVKAGKSVQFGEVRGGGSYISQNDPRLHFGLGTEAKMSEVEIKWPSRKTEVLRDVPADFIYTIVEGEGIKDKAPLPSIASSSSVKRQKRSVTKSVILHEFAFGQWSSISPSPALLP